MPQSFRCPTSEKYGVSIEMIISSHKQSVLEQQLRDALAISNHCRESRDYSIAKDSLRIWKRKCIESLRLNFDEKTAAEFRAISPWVAAGPFKSDYDVRKFCDPHIAFLNALKFSLSLDSIVYKNESELLDQFLSLEKRLENFSAEQDDIEDLYNLVLSKLSRYLGQGSEEFRQAKKLNPNHVTGSFRPGTDDLSRAIIERQHKCASGLLSLIQNVLAQVTIDTKEQRTQTDSGRTEIDMQSQASRRVVDIAKEVILSAFNSQQKSVSLEGGTLNSDPEVDAQNLEVSKYCQRQGWARTASNSEYTLILTYSGIEYAKGLLREASELSINNAIIRILDAAERNDWQLNFIEHDHGGLIQSDNISLAESEADEAIILKAFERMVYELGYLRTVAGSLYRVTEKGREKLHAVSSPSESSDLQSRDSGEVKMPVDRKKVFVVHGRNEAVLNQVELFLHRIGLEPIILFREVSEGRVVIEKFEYHASTAGYAIVILTPEDIGYLREEYNDGKGKGADEERARQNVVFEMGYFFARLGRGKVAALQQGHVTKPSDIEGIVYIPMRSGNSDWQLNLAKEMKSAGVDLNWEKIGS